MLATCEVPCLHQKLGGNKLCTPRSVPYPYAGRRSAPYPYAGRRSVPYPYAGRRRAPYPYPYPIVIHTVIGTGTQTKLFHTHDPSQTCTTTDVRAICIRDSVALNLPELDAANSAICFCFCASMAQKITMVEIGQSYIQ